MMSKEIELISEDIHEYLKRHAEKDMLRFLTCGSVDDGKSTLIGRLLHDSKMVFEDQITALERESKKYGTTNKKLDLALLVDGLQSEREQGITIDVAYRYFSTEKRKFIIADTPGHEQYTRNMATGASNCELAVILIDARHGLLTQTKRHSFIASLLGIKSVLVAINKMDLVDFSEEVYNEIRSAYLEFAENLHFEDMVFVPMSALEGDNVVNPSINTTWYKGPTLLEHLENVEIHRDLSAQPFRFPVQYVNRPNLDFRGFCGQVVSGTIRKGDEITVLPTRTRSKVKSIVTMDGDLEEAFPPLSITLTLEDEIDISRGDMIVKAEEAPELCKRVSADVVWMSEDPLLVGQEFFFKIGTKNTIGVVESIEFAKDLHSLAEEPTDRLELNAIGRCTVRFHELVPVDLYRENRKTGAFIFVDRITNGTVGAGMIDKVIVEESASENTASPFSAFELELNALIRKHFPHWEAKDISLMQLLGDKK